VKPEGVALQSEALIAPLPRTLRRRMASQLALRRRLRAPDASQEDGRAPTSVIIRTHVAGAAECDEIVERMIARKAEGLDVMHV
jgi:hypothetical protein